MLNKAQTLQYVDRLVAGSKDICTGKQLSPIQILARMVRRNITSRPTARLIYNQWI